MAKPIDFMLNQVRNGIHKNIGRLRNKAYYAGGDLLGMNKQPGIYLKKPSPEQKKIRQNILNAQNGAIKAQLFYDRNKEIIDQADNVIEKIFGVNIF